MWRWLFVQVGVPLFGPIFLAGLFAFAWSTGPNGFKPRFDIILEITPRALTFYCIALISITVAGFWDCMSRNPVVGILAIGTGGVVAVYHSFTVVWRHEANYVPTAETYYVTLILTFASIVVCAMCEQRKTK